MRYVPGMPPSYGMPGIDTLLLKYRGGQFVIAREGAVADGPADQAGEGVGAGDIIVVDHDTR